MQNHPISPYEITKSILRNKQIIVALTKREILGRYRGSVMGLVWSFLNPLLMLVVYTFVFSYVFKARWNSGSDSQIEFALLLFAGLMVFNIFSECVSRAPSLIVVNANYVKKVVFPLEVLPWVVLGSAIFHFAVSLFVWFLGYAIYCGIPHATVLYLPLIIIPLSLFTAGVSLFLSSLGVYLRDVSQIIGSVLTVLMFLTPIFYPVSSLPDNFQILFMLNPLTSIIEMTRDVLYWGNAPNFSLLLLNTSYSCLVAWCGFVWFQRTRKGFADVI